MHPNIIQTGCFINKITLLTLNLPLFHPPIIRKGLQIIYKNFKNIFTVPSQKNNTIDHPLPPATLIHPPQEILFQVLQNATETPNYTIKQIPRKHECHVTRVNECPQIEPGQVSRPVSWASLKSHNRARLHGLVMHF